MNLPLVHFYLIAVCVITYLHSPHPAVAQNFEPKGLQQTMKGHKKWEIEENPRGRILLAKITEGKGTLTVQWSLLPLIIGATIKCNFNSSRTQTTNIAILCCSTLFSQLFLSSRKKQKKSSRSYTRIERAGFLLSTGEGRRVRRTDGELETEFWPLAAAAFGPGEGANRAAALWSTADRRRRRKEGTKDREGLIRA